MIEATISDLLFHVEDQIAFRKKREQELKKMEMKKEKKEAVVQEMKMEVTV